MDVESLAKQLILQNMTPEQQNAVLESVRSTLQEARANQKRRVSENVGVVVEALNKIEADIRARYDDLGQKITDRVNSIQDGRDGIDGRDGKDGKDGRPGRDGATGPAGAPGRDGRDGIDGQDGVSVIDAKIDFDGSLIIYLSNGRELNVGEVMSPDAVERIRILTYAGDNSGGGGGTGLTYKGVWDASANIPLLISSAGTSGDYYIVSVAGTTDLNGITDWQPGDWVIFNGTAWQKIDQSWATAGANNNITSMTGITGGISSPDFIQFDTAATNTNTVGKLYWDDTQKTLTVGLTADIAADVGQTLYAYVTNAESVTINIGQPVYMYASQGDRVSVKLAYNTSDATSAKTLGVCAENIAAGQAGLVLCQGVQEGLNLGSYTAGDTLYLGATAGTLTATKPYAPNHLVYMGVVERANNGNGRLYVRVQNGYELDELHNVSAQNPTNGQTLIYNESTSLWEKHTLTDGTGISITEGAGSITIANSGVTGVTAGTGISVSASTGSITVTNSAPDQTVALTAGTGISTSGTYPNFTITNASPDQTVALTAGTGISVTGTYPNFSIANSGVTSVAGTANQVSVSASSGNVTLSLPSSINTNLNGSVGATTPNTGSFTSLTDSGNLTFTGTGNRITGDFSNATLANRVMFQNSVTNGSSNIQTLPNGTSNVSGLLAFANSDPANTSFAAFQSAGPEVRVTAGITGTGSYPYMTFYTGGSERMRLDTSGNVGIGTTSPTARVQINQDGASGTATAEYIYQPTATWSTTANFSNYRFIKTASAATDGSFKEFHVGAGGVAVGYSNTPSYGSGDALYVNGNVGIGTSSPASKLNVANGSITLTDGYGYTWGNTYITGYAGNYMAFATNGSERARIDSSGNLQFNSGYGSVATAYGCRAWVNFNGTGANGTNQTIRGSGNVSSVSKTSSGVYVMNFATAMPDTNYAALGTAIAGSAPAAPLNDTIGAYSFNTGNLGFQCTDGTSNTFTNPVFASIAIIR